MPWAAEHRPALGGWGHETGTEMLALLQHTHVFLPMEGRVLVLLDATGHNLLTGSALIQRIQTGPASLAV